MGNCLPRYPRRRNYATEQPHWRHHGPRCIPSAPRWVSEEDISDHSGKFLPPTQTHRAGHEWKKEQVEFEDCPICLEKMTDTTMNMVLTRCAHLFHTPCILMWLDDRDTCPLCNGRVPEERGIDVVKPWIAKSWRKLTNIERKKLIRGVLYSCQ